MQEIDLLHPKLKDFKIDVPKKYLYIFIAILTLNSIFYGRNINGENKSLREEKKYLEEEKKYLEEEKGYFEKVMEYESIFLKR